MSRSSRICILILLSLALLMSLSCGSPEAINTQPPVEITDQLGRSVKLDKIPQRIISLAPSNTEILYALGLADKVVAVTDYDDYPPEVKQKPSIGGFSTPNIEKIVSLSPDLVLATDIHKAQVIPTLEQRGITVMALAPKNLDDVMNAIVLVGKITGSDTEAAKLVADMQSRIKAVTDITNGLPQSQRPRVLYITWNDPLMTVGTGNLDDDIIREAGGINIAQNLSGSATITLEAVIAANPQVIIAGVGMGTGADQPYQFAMTEPRLRDTEARQNNHVYSIDMSLAGRAGPRIANVLEQFAAFIHPELFKEGK
jgi:iron complex transport system substrate-binding protein